jgi:hypothetical protein
MKRHLYIRVLGRGWYGQRMAQRREIDLGNLGETWKFTDPYDPEEVEDFIYREFGDFQSIKAYEAELFEEKWETEGTQNYVSNKGVEVRKMLFSVETTNYSFSQFTEEEQADYSDLMYPGEE